MVERPPIPDHLQPIQDQLDQGVDADDIPGIEELWIWRADHSKDDWDESHREFIRTLIQKTNENFEAGDYDEVNPLEVD